MLSVARLQHLWSHIIAAGVLAAGAAPALSAEKWESTVSPLTPGKSFEPRSVTARYAFGWHALTAATADIHLAKPSAGRYRFEITGGTHGLVQTLWNYQVRHTAISDAATLRPVEVKELETFRSKQIETELTFTPEGVTSIRQERRGSERNSKTRRFDFPDVLSLNSALLFLRAQPLPTGAVHRVVVYPATAAYLCTVTARGTERVTVPAGSYDAIKLDVQLNKIGKTRELLPHKKFRHAAVWLSNDGDRLVLRIKAQIFIGSVYGELQSMRFHDGNP